MCWLCVFLVHAPPAVAESEPLPEAIPLGDVPATESHEPENADPSAASSAESDGTESDRFAERDNEEGIPTLRGTFALGAQLALASSQLEPATGSLGGGGRLNLGFAPPTWPVLFGGSFELVGYQVAHVTYDVGGTSYQARIEQLSQLGQLFVRLQPERYTLRPYLDLTGGYWLFLFNQKLDDDYDEDDINTVRAAATGCVGVGVGLDWLFGHRGPWGNYGVGFDLRYTRGLGLPFPDYSTATGVSGALQIPGSTTIKAPAQVLFTLSFVVSSTKGNWATGTSKTRSK